MLRPTRALAVVLAVLVCAGPGCAPPETEAPLAPTVGDASGLAELPDGVALVIDGEPVEVAVIERHADALALLRPGDTRDALVRRVLADHVFARASMATAFAAERPAARAEIEAVAAALRASEEPEGALAWEGFVDELDPWLRVPFLAAAEGELLGPIEKSDGGFVVARVVRPFDPDGPIDQTLALEGWVANYARPPVPLPHEGCAGLEVRFADRRWRDLVPVGILHAVDLGAGTAP